MKLTDRLYSSVVFFTYCNAVVLVIVNGQPTTDDDNVDTDEIAELRARVGKMEELLAAAVEKTVMQQDTSESNYCRPTSHLSGH